MAESALFDARLKFLTNSAYSMLSHSNETSAFLMTQRDRLLFEAERDVKTAHQSCKACGTIFAAGKTSSVEIGKRQIIYNCNTCGSQTLHPLSQKPGRYGQKKSRSKLKQLSAKDLAPAPDRISHTKTGASSESSISLPEPANKKSAHERKKLRKQGGFQALLASKKAVQPQKGFGLDLMDLMKKS